MKKLKKVFGVFAVALLLMSMTDKTVKDTISKYDEIVGSCDDDSISISANNLACNMHGEDYTAAQYNNIVNKMIRQCITRGSFL